MENNTRKTPIKPFIKYENAFNQCIISPAGATTLLDLRF
jgi:hypothetical protein